MAKVEKATPTPEIYVARSSGVVKINGVVHRYYRGLTRIPAGHALLRMVPDKFEPMRLDYVKPEA